MEQTTTNPNFSRLTIDLSLMGKTQWYTILFYNRFLPTKFNLVVLSVQGTEPVQA